MKRNLDSVHIQPGVWYPGPPDRSVFHSVGIDSRRVFSQEGVLFFCIRGQRHDGHRFLEETRGRGIRYFVVDTLPEHLHDDTFYLLVPDTLVALQQLASGHRQTLNAIIFGITGSNGKTIVKEWLYTLLHMAYRVARSPRSFNSQIGVPLSLLLVSPAHEIALLEAGISRPDEMDRLQAMIQPQIGIMTYLGGAHDEGFDDRRHKLMEKLRLFAGCTTLIVPAALTADFAEAFAALPCRLIRWGYDAEAELQIMSTRVVGGHREVRYRYEGETHEYPLPHTDEASLHNSLSALLGARVAGLTPEAIHEGMRRLPTLTMRLEIRAGRHGNLLVNDYYNADPDSLRIALDLFSQRRGNLRGWIILGDMDETGLTLAERAALTASLLEPIPCDRISLIGDSASATAQYITRGVPVDVYRDVHDFLAHAGWDQVRNTAILLKGGRRFTLEHISRRLILYAHRTRMEINLSALSHNLRVCAGMLQPGVRLLVMVKASAYGSGSTEIARWLHTQRVDYLGVAYADEGAELRQAGVSLPILVMNADESAFPVLISARLEPQIHSLRQLRELLHFLSPGDPVLRIHIKLETGMNRLGLTADQIAELLRLLQSSGQLEVASVLSHLAASEDNHLDHLTHLQAERFENMAGQIARGLGYQPVRHLLNSSGISRFPQYQYEMVRLGIGLYGMTGRAALPDARPALSLRTQISRVHTVAAGEGVGYGNRDAVNRPRSIATLAIGYADGLLRLAGNGRFQVFIHGQAAPTVGSICMDMCMVDVTHIPQVREGDEAIIFDETHPIQDLADALHTIPYEILTNISTRVPRIYYEE